MGAGQGQFDVLYRHTVKESKGREETSQHVLPLAQGTGSMHLFTTPGDHKYEVLAVGDSAYPLRDPKFYKKVLHAFEQHVFERPGASIRLSKRPSFCLNDNFTASKSRDNKVVLRGQPPFTLDIEVFGPGTNKPIKHTIEGIMDREWPIALEDYTFDRSGTFVVSVVGVRDGSQCTAEVTEDDVKTMVVEVVEPAQIMAVDRREHYCVGDMLEFKLQGEHHGCPVRSATHRESVQFPPGTAPWTIKWAVVICQLSW